LENQMKNLIRSLLLAVMAPLAVPAQAEDNPKVDAQEVVSGATFTIQRLFDDPDFTRLKAMAKDAKGVLIIPSLLKAGFILGAEGGNGVLLSRDANGVWSYPSFYTLGGGSIGLQAGFQDSEVVLLILTNNGLNAVLNNNVTLGVDASVAAGPVGQGIEGSTTTNFGADIAAFSKTRGLFGGGALKGALAYERDDLASAYYNTPNVTARAIVMERLYTNAGADALRAALATAN
jgi:lipid-binding SYLF domain-containing protein